MDSDQVANTDPPHKLWVLGCFIGALLFLNFIAVPILDAANRGPSEALISTYIGFLIGECIFLVVLGALCGTSWVDGYLLGCALAGAGVLVSFMGASLVHSGPPDEVWASFLLVPGAVFGAYCPMLFMRHFANWRLVIPGKRYPRLSNDLGGIFVNIALIASILVTLRGPQVFWQFEPMSYWLSTLGVGAFGILIAAIVTVPMARIVVNCDDPIRLLIRLGVLAIGGAAAFLLTMLFIAAVIVRQPLPNEFFFYFPVGVIVALVVVYVGVQAIRASGLRFQTAARTNLAGDAIEANANVNATGTVTGARYRLRTTCVVASIFLSAIVLNVFVSRSYANQQSFKLAIAEATEVATEAGGKVGATKYGEPVVAALYTASNDQLIRFLEPIIENQPALSVLDLRGCDIDDTALAEIGKLKHLVTLDLSDTRVSGSGFSQLSGLRLGTLKLDGLDLMHADWSALYSQPLHTFGVDDAKLSQNEFAAFLRQSHVVDLSAANLQCEPELRDSISKHVKDSHLDGLDLENTNVDDEFVRTLHTKREYRRLDLSGTKVTDQAIEHLAKARILRLRLARTSVTDAGIAKLSASWPHTYSNKSYLKDAAGVWQWEWDFGSTLDLTETEIDGRCLTNWKDLPRQLNLTRTNVDDSLVDHLNRFAECDELNLTGTKITDAILPDLIERYNIRKIIIADTGITVNALIRMAKSPANFSNRGSKEWAVAPGQFTAAERNSIEAAGLSLTVETPDDSLERTVP